MDSSGVDGPSTKAFILAFLFFLILTIAIPVSVSAATIYVPDDYSTIQGAVDTASSGDTIIVRDGTYNENVVVSKDNLAIKSENGANFTTVQAEDSTYNTFEIRSDDIRISGFSITGATEYLEGEGYAEGIGISHSNGTVVENNDIYGNRSGIVFYSCENCKISNNTISNQEFGDGIWVSFGSENLLKNNVLRNNNTAIYLHSTTDNTIILNELIDNGWTAFSIDDYDGAGSEGNVIIRNIIEAGTWAIQFRRSNDNIFYLNDFLTKPETEGFITYQSSSSSNRWYSPSELSYNYEGTSNKQYLGNYWSDYSGRDTDSDGIGDTAYNINSESDNYPLMEPFENYTGTEEQPVNFPDENLEQAIRDAIGKQSGEIYPSDLEGLTELDAREMGIEDLTGIEYCKDLTILYLRKNNISDVSPLSELKNLNRLYFGYNDISNISPLSDLGELKFLSLGDNSIRNVTALSELSNLEDLYLWDNKIVDLTPLGNLTSLTALNIYNNDVEDISPLSGLTELQYLMISYNNIGNLEPLSNLTNLRSLHFVENEITDISPISNLTNLESLVFNGNDISDISPLSSLDLLQCLEARRNQIASLAPLAGLTELRYLLVANNQIEDLQPLENLTKLGDPLQDLDPLPSDVPHLDLKGNYVSDITPLVNNSGLASGDKINIIYNELNISMGSEDMGNIQTLFDRGVEVEYEPQKKVSLIEDIDIAVHNEGYSYDVRLNRPAKSTWYLYDKNENLVHEFGSDVFATWHTGIRLGYLPEGESGYIRLEMEDEHGQVALWPGPDKEDKFKLEKPGAIAPKLVKDLTASSGGDGGIDLTWTNPGTSDLAEVIVRRNKEMIAPVDHNDGHLVKRITDPVPGRKVTHKDTEVSTGENYYYAVFTKNTKGNWNDVASPNINAYSIDYTPTTHPIPYVVSHWNTEDDELDPDDDPTIDMAEILTAVAWWANETKVPKTGGKTIDMDMILKLIGYWSKGKEITETTSNTARTGEGQTRTSDITHLKDLTHELSTNELPATETLTANLSFSTEEEIAGLVLDLNLPEGWSLVEEENSKVTYKPSTAQLLWLDLEKGETKQLTYKLLPPSDIEATTEYEIKGKLLSKSPNLKKQLPTKTITLTRLPELSLKEATVSPNPVTTNQNLTFRAEGQGIVSTKIQVFNTSGKKLYQTGYRKGNTITWNLTDPEGEELINGIYLYRMKAKGKDGTTQSSEVRRLLVSR